MQNLKTIVFPGVHNLPNYAAEKFGFFEKRGLSVQTTFTKSSEEQRSGLAEGLYDIAHSAVDNAVAMVDSGMADVCIFVGLDQSFNKIVVRPDISSYADLRGKVLGVDAPDTAFALIVYHILKQKGLKPGDYTVKPIGATRFRIQALIDGTIDFAIMTLPFNLLAQRAGLTILDDPIALVAPYQSAGGFARSDWAAKNRDALVQYAAAYIEGVRWSFDPANRQTASRILQDEMKLDADIIDQCLSAMLDPVKGMDADAKLSEAGMKKMLALRAEFTGTQAPPVSRYVDESYYRDAIAALGK
jgi:ABC-type nitrate/sulfonate/bicarbonate transport system substrate-binding protein